MKPGVASRPAKVGPSLTLDTVTVVLDVAEVPVSPSVRTKSTVRALAVGSLVSVFS